jgi:acylphosphatase
MYTRDFASELGLTGWVRNLPDGRVEVLAEGPEKALQSLESWLHSGPPLAEVDLVECSYSDQASQFNSFSVTR